MGGRKTGGKWLAICGTLLLLIWGTTATDLEGGPAVQDSTHMQEGAEVKENSLLTFLAWWREWTSQASARPLVRGDASKVSKQQEGPPLQQSPHRDKTPCKNFFWKTFSSCK
ncbi:cortistatin [Castor canadensis]|uniref:Cortistatin n=1 Tax=Castor canadensis TaxID=51338 RepID=A0A8B7WCK5_CASCN|nr:cortistatin [Castor canadensis]